ncbi:MAG: crossover junction endodeoxyribonuclease RuvC [Patescibacteria group bacterium]|nr:crossover junction endodeoxyribonuclease RuvC [Patescibacteria group bacterium]MDD5121186.1 crossover junction endodeoxyribonuclease RuvC [Patescibacteria group bacterium]MDD5221998.1 crossover junction endodeoxyribonuclease RuvC [Patescibacteria group bacterium]MDD5395895.1 crossover junction endodeoxyribonuclease RuvC [Patescibacteria group bacterium]
MIILGIDPGFAITGYGLIKFEPRTQKIEVLDQGCIKTSLKNSFIDRLMIIYEQMNEVVKKNKPDKVAMEKIFFAKNMKTAMQVGEARGVISLVLAQHKLSILELTPLQVKQSLTGYGQATKQQMQKMVKMVLRLKEIPRPDDVADALAIAICASCYREH